MVASILCLVSRERFLVHILRPDQVALFLILETSSKGSLGDDDAFPGTATAVTRSLVVAGECIVVAEAPLMPVGVLLALASTTVSVAEHWSPAGTVVPPLEASERRVSSMATRDAGRTANIINHR